VDLPIDNIWFEAAKLTASFFAILLLAWVALRLGLGGDVRIRDEDHAASLAQDAVFGFAPTAIALDKARIAAVLKDKDDRHILVRRHGAHFAARLLDRHSACSLDLQFLTIATSDTSFGATTLNLGDQAQYWAAGLRRLAV
jgi:hypothetical protein